MNYRYEDNGGRKSSKNGVIAAVIIALVVVIVVNVVAITLVKNNMEKEYSAKLTELEKSVDAKVSDTLSAELSEDITEKVKDTIVEDVTSTSLTKVTNTITDQVLAQYRREYNLPEDYFCIGLVANSISDATMEISASSETNFGKIYKNSSNRDYITYGSAMGNTTQTSSQSTCVIITSDGYVITNAHCVSFEDDVYSTRTRSSFGGSYTEYYASGKETRTYDTLTASFKDSDTKYTLEVIAYDTTKDLAVAKITNTSGIVFKSAQFADSDLINMGEEVAVMGNAGGLGISITTGVVSIEPAYDEQYKEELFRTDAAVNPGNSGGGIYNVNGELIGIVSAKIVSTSIENMGFAIAANEVIDYIDSVITSKSVTINYKKPVTA